MAHEHGSEYQLKVILVDGKENLTEWLSEEQLTAAMSVAQRRKGTTCWLRVRKVVCVQCAGSEQASISEFPVTQTGSSRNLPHDSKYLMAAGVRNRSQVNRPDRS
jgi:hypothetical protein